VLFEISRARGGGNFHRDHFAIARRSDSHERGQNRWFAGAGYCVRFCVRRPRLRVPNRAIYPVEI
jgi:hypothetical protein